VGAGGVGVDIPDPFGRLSDILGADVHYPQSADFYRQGLRAKPFAAAGLARARRHIALNLVAHVVGLGPFVAAFQVGDHAFEFGVPFVALATVGPVTDGDLLLVVPVEDHVQVFRVQVLDRRFRRETVGLGHRLHQADVPTAGRSASSPRRDGPLGQR